MILWTSCSLGRIAARGRRKPGTQQPLFCEGEQFLCLIAQHDYGAHGLGLTSPAEFLRCGSRWLPPATATHPIPLLQLLHQSLDSVPLLSSILSGLRSSIALCGGAGVSSHSLSITLTLGCVYTRPCVSFHGPGSAVFGGLSGEPCSGKDSQSHRT